MPKTYVAPRVKDLGSLQQMTAQSMNKVGPTPDVLTQINPDVIGSFTPFP